MWRTGDIFRLADAGMAEAQYEVGMGLLEWLPAERRDRGLAAKLLKAAAEAKHKFACLAHARCLHLGIGGVQDAAEACRLLALAISTHAVEKESEFQRLLDDAREGTASAMFSVAWHVLRGTRSEIDDSQAVAWLERASELGYQPATIHLAERLLRGDGMTQDVTKASDAEYENLKTRALAGDKEARRQVKEVNSNRQLSARQFLEVERKAASGHPRALYYLALKYLFGDSVDQDLEQAERLLREAADRGDGKALYRLGVLILQGDMEARAIDEAKRLLERAATTECFFPHGCDAADDAWRELP
jgi:TPR repeat protein